MMHGYIYMHKTMVSVASLEKIEIIRSQEFMPSEVRLKFLKKMIILGPKTAILGPQFWCWGLIFGGQEPNSFVFAYIFTEKRPRRRSTPLTGPQPQWEIPDLPL